MSEQTKWEKTDLSPSRLKMWLDCPKKYEYNYVQRIKTGDRDFFFMGNVMDEVVLEEFRHDIGQAIEPIIQIAGDELLFRMKNSETLVHGLGAKAGQPFTEEEMLRVVMDFRTWARGFLSAIQNGEDTHGNKLSLPPITDMQVECFWPIEIDGQKIRVRGYADMLHSDGSVTDLKMASAWAPVRWTHGRILSELQWVMYSQGLNSNRFRYLVVDKLKTGRWPNQVAGPPSVRLLSTDVYPQDVQNIKDIIVQFVRSTDFLNFHENGVFPPKPNYNGVANKMGREVKELKLTENNFCQNLCDYKERCFNDCFGGDFRKQGD